MTTTGSKREGRRTAALSRELSEFLVELSIAVHRYAMYPADHPSLRPAVENVISGLTDLLQDRPSLSIGAARRQLLIEGVATDERHPVLADLARRMHAHQLGGVTFSRGATLTQMAEAVQTLARDPEREGRPIGSLPEADRPSWSHVQLIPAGYDRLVAREAGGEDSEPRQMQLLWVGLAQAALEEEGLTIDDVPAGRVLAQVIEGRSGEAGYDEVIVQYLLHLAEEFKGGMTPEDERVREEIAGLIQELDQEALDRILKMGAGAGEARRLARHANRGGLGVDAVVKILRAGVRSDDQTISSSLSRLLGKLSTHARTTEGSQRAEAESAIRENVEALISDWELGDPNPGAYTEILDRMAVAVPEFESSEPAAIEDRISGAERVLKMALEMDAFGPAVRRAMMAMVDEGHMSRVFELLDEAPAGSDVADRLQAILVTPGHLGHILSGEDVDEESLRMLVDRIGPDSVEQLYHFLRESESRAVRRKVFDTLSRMGDEVVGLAVDSLQDERWFVKRNMLALLQRMEELPPGFSALDFLHDEDVRVRREAHPLAFRTPDHRMRALASALADEDERIVRMALLEVQDAIPETIVPVVVNRVLGDERFPSLRALAVRALRHARSPLAREALLRVCSGGKSLWGRSRLARGSPEVIAALSALADNWRRDPQAGTLLAAARGSKDPRIRGAAESAEAGGGALS